MIDLILDFSVCSLVGQPFRLEMSGWHKSLMIMVI
jgi:hypothetical protein